MTEVGEVSGGVRLDVGQLKRAQRQVNSAFRDMQKSADKADAEIEAVDETMAKGTSTASTFSQVLGAELTGEALVGVVSWTGQATHQLASMTTQVAKTASESRRMGKSLDVSTQTVQELRFALKKMGIEGSEATEVFTTISERQQQALDGSGDMVNQFEKLGISMAELEGKSPDQLLTRIERGLRETADPTKRMAVAVELLGDEVGKKLVNRMADGEKSLADFRAEARRLGIAMSDDMVADLDRANASMRELESSTEALKKLTAAEAAPALAEAADAASDLANVAVFAAQGWDKLENSFLGRWVKGTIRGTANLFTAGLVDQTGDIVAAADRADKAVRGFQASQEESTDSSSRWAQALNDAHGELEHLETAVSSASASLGTFSGELAGMIQEGAQQLQDLRDAQITGLEADIERLKNKKVGLDDALKIARTDRAISGIRARIKDLQADMAAAAGEVAKADKLRAQAQGLRLQGRQGEAKAAAEQRGRGAAQSLAGRAQAVAGRQKRSAVSSAIAAARGATGQATGEGGDAAERQAEVARTRRNRNFAQSKQFMQAHSAEAKKVEQTQRAVNDTLEQRNEQLQSGIGKLQSMTSEILSAAGASRELQAGLSGAFEVAQGISKLSMLSTASNPVLAGLAGVSSIVTGIAGAAGAAQSDTGGQESSDLGRSQRRRDRRLATWIGEETAEAMDKQQREIIIIGDNPGRRDRSPVREMSAQHFREQSRALRREQRLNPGAI